MTALTRPPRLLAFLLIATVAVTGLVTTSLTCQPAQVSLVQNNTVTKSESVPASNPRFPAFAASLSPTYPRDVDKPFYDSLHVDSLAKKGQFTNYQFARARRLMDIYSWQMFISLNWPVDEERALLFSADTSLAAGLDCPEYSLLLVCPFPDALRKQFEAHNVQTADSVVTKIVVEGEMWEVLNKDDYMRPFLIKREGGMLEIYGQLLPKSSISSDGIPFWMTWKESVDVYRPDGAPPTNWYAPEEWPSNVPDSLRRSRDPEKEDPLFTTHKAGVLDENDQPGADTPLWDQNGNMVYYEIRMNKVMFDDIVQYALYNLEGQINYAKTFGGDMAAVGFDWGNSDASKPFAIGATEIKLAWKILDEEKGDIPERFFRKKALVKMESGDWEVHEMGLVGFHIGHKTLSSMSWIWSTFEHIDNVRVDDLLKVKDRNTDIPLKPLFFNPDCETCPVNVRPDPDQSGMRRTQVHRMIDIPEATDRLNWEVRDLLENAGSVFQYYELVGTQWATNGFEDQGPIMPVNLVNAVMETYYQQGNQEVRQADGKRRLEFRTQSCLKCHGFAKLAVGCSIVNDSVQVLYSKKPHSGDYSWLLQKAQWQRKPDSSNPSC